MAKSNENSRKSDALNVISDVGGGDCGGQVLKYDFLIKLKIKVIAFVKVHDAEFCHFVLDTDPEAVSTLPRVQFGELAQANVSAFGRLVFALLDQIFIVLVATFNFCVGTSNVRRISAHFAGNLPCTSFAFAITLANGSCSRAQSLAQQQWMSKGMLVLAPVRALLLVDSFARHSAVAYVHATFVCWFRVFGASDALILGQVGRPSGFCLLVSGVSHDASAAQSANASVTGQAECCASVPIAIDSVRVGHCGDDGRVADVGVFDTATLGNEAVIRADITLF